MIATSIDSRPKVQASSLVGLYNEFRNEEDEATSTYIITQQPGIPVK